MTEVLTVGYEGSDVTDFVAVLVSLHVEILCDVRDVTASRKKGFSKNPLADALNAAGIKYQHFRSLGDPKEGRLAARSGDYASFRRIYDARLSTEAAQLSLLELGDVAADHRVCLMCFEREPKECHRSIVADALRDKRGYGVRHIGIPKGFAGRVAGGRPGQEKSSNNPS